MTACAPEGICPACGHRESVHYREQCADCPEGYCEAGTSRQTCEMDGDRIDTYGGEHYWHCGNPGVLTVEGTLMCEDHAGERGYGPKQEEYGFDPDDGLNPTPVTAEPVTTATEED